MLLDSQKMANNVQFEKWNADEVAEWLRGLDMDDAMIPYMHFFLNNGVDGRKLMLMTHADLEKLNVVKLGHQELILEAIDLLRTLRYGYETENLQYLALQLGCKARSLNSEVRACSGENDRNRANTPHSGDVFRPRRLSIGILSSVADLVFTLKGLVAWMDKAPFSGFHDLCLVRNTIVKMGLELINMCQKESTIPDVEHSLSTTTNGLSEICEKLVIGSSDSPLDPLYVQPASLELATIRKKQGEELGMHILSSYYGVHVISGIKDMSPADLCGKIEKGDEVIQVNHQTVVGWQLKKLVNTLKEKPKEVVLLLKKRPRHISPYGQMPNKKKQNLMNKHAVQASTLPKSLKKLRSRDGEPKQLRPSLQEFVNSVPSTGDELYSPKEPTDGNDTDNDVFRSGSESPQFTLPVIPDPKQRRATVSGGSPTLSRPLLVIEDIDTPSRPKSFTITGTSTNMPHEIIINSPSGDNLTDLHKFVSAMENRPATEKRQEYKTKSTPPSLEFSVRKPTPKIIEPKDIAVGGKSVSKGDKSGKQKTDTTITVRAPDSDCDSPQKHEDVFSAESQEADDVSTDTSIQSPERTTHSPERLLDSSTDSVPPSESSIESSQTCTSSLESSSHSPPLESSASSEKESSDFATHESAIPRSIPQTFEVPYIQRTPPTRRLKHAEVASDFNKNQPQLMKIRKIESVRIVTPEPEAEKKERHVAFSGVDSDKETEDSNSYVCKIVGGVVQKIPVTGKGSPSESPVVKRRPKTGRSKRVDRRVSCKDLGKGDCEGWLYKRRTKGGNPLSLHHWQKRWCIIKDYNLFCYHDKQALKADVVVHLPAFQISPVDATELKTKKFAFKIHNLGTSFLFASDRQEDMSKWMNKMGLAAIAFRNNEKSGFKKPEHGKYKAADGENDFSESETEDDPDHSLHGSLPDLAHDEHTLRPGSHEMPHGILHHRSPSPTIPLRSSHTGSKSDLQVPPVEMRASQEDLSCMIRKQSQKGQNIYGEDKNKQRKSVLSRELIEQVSPEVIKLKKIKSLERTLRSKEKELLEIEEALTSQTPEKMQVFRDLLNTTAQDTDSD